ncbi:hypothetical protein [Brachymonas sp.]|uniref:hypothetical protein n=1 Tax=Brachymonas sp. TaxID=1936292 RepID=UPI0035AF0CF4
MSRLLLPAPAFPAALRRGAARLARLGTCMTLIGTACALPAQTLTGLYARGKTHDAIFATSDASGDLIGYAVAHGSPLAKALARRCLQDLGCSIEAPRTAALSQQAALQAQFRAPASGYVHLVDGHDPSLSSLLPHTAAVDTRYGRLAISQPGPSAHLTFRGHAVLPGIEGNSALTIAGLYPMGDRDIALVEIIGGSACPSLFHFVTISRSGISASREFGSCSDVAVAQFQHGQLTLRMPKMQGEGMVTYRYTNGLAIKTK